MANRSSQDNARSLSPSRSRRFVTVETCQRLPRRVSMPRLFSSSGDCPEAGRTTRANIRNHRCQVLRMPVHAREGEDDIPETPADPVSRSGDLWSLGPHRLLCGDSTVATHVERALGSVTPAANGQRPAESEAPSRARVCPGCAPTDAAFS